MMRWSDRPWILLIRRLKTWMKRTPRLRRACHKARLVIYAIGEGLWRAALTSRRRDESSSVQQALTWGVAIPPVTSPSELVQ